MTKLLKIKDKSAIAEQFRRAYKALNGIINPMNKAKEMILIGDDISFDEECTNSMNGSAAFQRLKIYVDATIRIIENGIPASVYSDRDVNGFILGTVAHELSHLDQFTPWYLLYNLKKYEKCKYTPLFGYEIENELRACTFLEKFHNEIRDQLGEYDIGVYKDSSTYLTELYEFAADNPDFKDIYFKKYSGYDEMVWNDLSIITMIDMKDLVTDTGAKRICMRVDNPITGYSSWFEIDTRDIIWPTMEKTTKMIHEDLCSFIWSQFIGYTLAGDHGIYFRKGGPTIELNFKVEKSHGFGRDLMMRMNNHFEWDKKFLIKKIGDYDANSTVEKYGIMYERMKSYV